MFPKVNKILKLSANNLDEINSYLSKGAVILSCDSVPTSEISSQTSYFYIGLIDSTN